MTLAPAGDVTFLFSDIEGSTKLLGRHPAAYAAALFRHDELMRAAVGAHRGVVFETVGDAVYAAFSSAADAVGGALRAQLDLHAEDWGELGELRVRMAVHGGPVERRGDHFFGPALYRCARLMAIGHGGQVLLSGSVAEAVRGRLPDGARVRPMGIHLLKDLADPEKVSQLTHPDLRADFPALRSLSPHASNLPDLPTGFIGRERERSEVEGLLARARVVTLTGPGGIGKTRLAIQVASAEIGRFADGVWFVSLSAIRDPALVPSAIAGVLKVAERRGEPLLETVTRHVAAKELLLVLDNLEQLTEAALTVAQLIAAAPGLKILATSRIPLHILSEQQYLVPPLDVARSARASAEPRSDAATLFIQRALAVKPDLVLDHEALEAIAQVCARVDGLPLAIELAAARTNVLGPRALLARLGTRLPLLSSPSADRSRRHQSMRAAIEWSHELLNDVDRAVFERVGVFVGGFTLDAAAALCSSVSPELIDSVGRLVDASLVRQEVQPDGEPRFFMLETIREYALERLTERGLLDSVRADHAGHFLGLAQTAAQEISADMKGSVHRMTTEHDNARAALEWFMLAEQAESALRMCNALWWFWQVCGHMAEGLSRLRKALALHQEVPPMVRAKALSAAGQIALQQGDAQRSRAWHEEALAIARLAGDAQEVSVLIHDLGNVALLEGDDARARELCEQSLAMQRELGGSSRSIAHRLLSLVEIARYQGDYVRARTLFDEGMSLAPDGAILLGYDLNGGMLALEQGEHERAQQLLQESLRGWRDVDARVFIATAETGLAGLASVAGDPLEAARLLGAAEGLLEPLGAVLWPADRRAFERISTSTRAALSASAFETARRDGRNLTLETVVNEGLAFRLPGLEMAKG